MGAGRGYYEKKAARMRIQPMGDRALIIDIDDADANAWGQARVIDAVLAVSAAIAAANIPGITELVPAAQTVVVTIDPNHGDPTAVHSRISQILANSTAAGNTSAAATTHHHIPVTYTGDDLAEVAEHYQVSVEALVKKHTSTTWTAAFGGFAPGFSYLVCDDPWWNTPRRAQPRPSIPQGSVALAGGYSGVYPQQSPGGWQILGFTDQLMFDVDATPPNLIGVGDLVTFVEDN